LSYKAAPTKGGITFGTGGSFTYTPTASARAAAASPTAPASAKLDTFTVTVQDGYGGTTTKSLTVNIAPTASDTGTGTGPIVVGSTSLAGGPWLPPLLTKDGTRAVVTTLSATGSTTQVAVINPATGAQTGNTLTFAGNPEGTYLLNSDGSRALLVTSSIAAVINPVTGVQTGASVGLTGDMAGSPVVSQDGTHAVITSNVHDLTANTFTVQVTVVDTATGTQTGRTVVLPGSASSATLLSEDGTTALVTTEVTDPKTNVTSTRLAVIDTTTGTQKGATLIVPGEHASGQFLTADGNRAVITTSVYDTTARADTTQVTVIDATTGLRVDSTQNIVGAPFNVVLLGANGDQAAVTTVAGDSGDGTYTTRATVIDTTTGTAVLTNITSGSPPYEPLATTAEKHTVISAQSFIGATGVYTTTVSVIDAATGTRIGTPVPLNGYILIGSQAGQTPLSEDGTHILVTTYARDSATYTNSTQVAVIDTTTGIQTGPTLTLPGATDASRFLTADGSRVLATTRVPDPTTGITNMRVALIDTATGAQTSTTVTGYLMGAPQLTPDGKHVVMTTGIFNLATGTTTTQVTVIDTTTGTQTSTKLSGAPSDGLRLTADGSRALVTTFATDQRTGYTTGTKLTVLRIG
jgi:hypothetical protein